MPIPAEDLFPAAGLYPTLEEESVEETPPGFSEPQTARRTNIQVPHLALPFSYSPAGMPAMNEQDSPDDIAACVEAVLRYPVGSRLEAPHFGISDQAFRENGADIAEIADAIEDQEPRASAVVDAVEDAESLAEAVQIVRVELQ